MSRADRAEAPCLVKHADRLPAGTSGAALCAALASAVARQGSDKPPRVEFEIVGDRSISATIIEKQRRLPTLILEVSDRRLSASDFDQFANDVADHIARMRALPR